MKRRNVLAFLGLLLALVSLRMPAQIGNGYIMLGYTTYTSINAAWSAALTNCAASNPTPQTIWIGAGTFAVTAPLVEPEVSYCPINLKGAGQLQSILQPTSSMTAVISKAATVVGNGAEFDDFGIECATWASGSNYTVEAAYGFQLQWARGVRISRVTVQDCGTSAGGENFAFGEDNLPPGHAFGGILFDLTSTYQDGVYPGGSGYAAPAYNFEFKSTAADSLLLASVGKNALTANLVVQAGASDIHVDGFHGFGDATYSRAAYTIQDFGSLDTYLSPKLDSFHYAGIDMEGSYNTVTAPVYEWGIALDATSYLFVVGTGARFDKILDGQCHANNNAPLPTSAFLRKDGGSISEAPTGWEHRPAAGCSGLYDYAWTDPSSRAYNYTSWSSGAQFTINDLYLRNAGSSTGTHFGLSVHDSATNPLLTVSDYADTTTGSLATRVVTYTSSQYIANGVGTAIADASGGSLNLVVPPCTSATSSSSDASSGRSLDVWKKDGTSNTVTLTGGTFVTSGGPAGGSGSVVLSTQYTAKMLVCDPTTLWWFVK